MNNELNNNNENKISDVNNHSNQNIEKNNSSIINQIIQKKHSPLITILIIVGLIVLGSLIVRLLIFGMAAGSVNDSINKTKLLSVDSAAQTAAFSIKTKMTEESIAGDLSNVYSNELFSVKGYNFKTYKGKKISESNPAIYYISSKLSNTFNFPKDTYILSDSNFEVTNKNKIDTSFFVLTDKDVILCLIVNKDSDYYIKRAALKSNRKVAITDNLTVSFKNRTMFSCSNSQNSWEDIKINN